MTAVLGALPQVLQSQIMAAAADQSGNNATADALRALYDAVSPNMHAQLKATPSLAPGLPPTADSKTFNFDEGHAGRVSVPGSDAGASVSIDWAMMQTPADPLQFLFEKLTFGDGEPVERIVFVPGLNSLHQPASGETTTTERLKHYTRVLGMPMAQIHTGTSMDQGDVRVNVTKAASVRKAHELLAGKLDEAGIGAREENGQDGSKTLVWAARQIDTIQLMLSQYGQVDTPVKKSVRKLLETTADPAGKPFVLVAYSRAAVEVEAAIREYASSHSNVAGRLRERVTVVTIGNASRDWADGPCYIHVAAWNDPMTTQHGVSGRSPLGAGKDAVFINGDTPFNPKSFDNHNFGAVTSQLLAVVMQANGVRSFRALHKLGSTSKLVVPGDVDQLTRAMIQMTKGYDWLWSPKKAWEGVALGALPGVEGAESQLRGDFGTEFIDQLKHHFP
jgi:hypothetical protein